MDEHQAGELAPLWDAHKIDIFFGPQRLVRRNGRTMRDEYEADRAATRQQLAALRSELAQAKANERKPMRVIKNTLGTDALVSYLMDNDDGQLTDEGDA